MGHRQKLTVFRITDILAAGKKNPATKKTKSESQANTPEETKSRVKPQSKAEKSKSDGAEKKRAPSKKTPAKKGK